MMRFLIAVFVITLVQQYCSSEDITIVRFASFVDNNESAELAFDDVHGGWHIRHHAPRTQVETERDNFLNRTITKMPTGQCIKEVPTSTLYHGVSANVPRGNGSNPSLSRIQTCCDGYKRNEHILRKCDPICTKECVNGVCFAPNECVCLPGHVRYLDGSCVLTCPNGCQNGRCNGNKCECRPGYTLDQTKRFCTPTCNPPCGKGVCTEANVCVCDPGYEHNGQGRCVAKCSHGCEFGDCVAPEVCSCRPGYHLIGFKCTPSCPRGCVNGECVGPNQCGCTRGFTLDASGTKCEAKCDQPCLNGICSGPNTCSCNSGYELDRNDSHKCVPHCPGGCPNGVCSGPGLCLCNPGFVKDRVTKICVPRT